MSRRTRAVVYDRYRPPDVLRLEDVERPGMYRPVIDRRYLLKDVVEATRYVETEQEAGNVVLIVSPV